MNIPITDSKQEVEAKLKQLGDMAKAFVKRNGYTRERVSETLYYNYD